MNRLEFINYLLSNIKEDLEENTHYQKEWQRYLGHVIKCYELPSKPPKSRILDACKLARAELLKLSKEVANGN